MIHIGPTVWRKFSGETTLVKRVQAFLWMNVGEHPPEWLPIKTDYCLLEAKALIHLIRKQDQADDQKEKKRRLARAVLNLADKRKL